VNSCDSLRRVFLPLTCAPFSIVQRSTSFPSVRSVCTSIRENAGSFYWNQFRWSSSVESWYNASPSRRIRQLIFRNFWIYCCLYNTSIILFQKTFLYRSSGYLSHMENTIGTVVKITCKLYETEIARWLIDNCKLSVWLMLLLLSCYKWILTG